MQRQKLGNPLFASTVPLYFLWKLIWRFQFTPASVYRMPCALRVLSAAAALLFAVVLIKVFLVPGLPCGHTLYAAGTGAYLLCTGLELTQTLFEAAHNMLTCPTWRQDWVLGCLACADCFVRGKPAGKKWNKGKAAKALRPSLALGCLPCKGRLSRGQSPRRRLPSGETGRACEA